MTRGISDRDAKRFFNSIKDLAGAYGIVQNKDKTIDGFGLIHISEHYSKLIDVINPKYSSIKEALEETVKNPKFTVRSKESKLYINPLGNDGRFFLLAVFHVSGLFVTFYHVDDSSDGLINTIKMMVLRKNANFYKHNTENDYYMVSFFSNDKYTYIIKYKKKDAIVYINAEKMTKPQFELLSTEFIQDKDIPEADKNCFKNFYENNKKRVINLAALAA